jgi:hypothetical protein
MMKNQGRYTSEMNTFNQSANNEKFNEGVHGFPLRFLGVRSLVEELRRRVIV